MRDAEANGEKRSIPGHIFFMAVRCKKQQKQQQQQEQQIAVLGYRYYRVGFVISSGARFPFAHIAYQNNIH